MKLIALIGNKGHGKDTAAEPLIAAGYKQVRMADPLKAMMRALLHAWGYDAGMIYRCLEGDLKEWPCPALAGQTPRHAMQTLGHEWRNTIAGDFWLMYFERALMEAKATGYPVVCTDIRYAHEADLIRRQGGVLVRVIRPGWSVDASHASEREVANIQWDYIVSNDSTVNELQNQIMEIAKQ